MAKPKIRFFGITLFLSVILLWAQGLNAQEEDGFTLPEITVTAEKREVDVQDTAMSVTAISGADIRDKAQNTLEEVLRDVASVEVAYANRGGQVNIRGIGSYVDTSMADPAVAVIEDNIYNGNSLATFGSMYDTNRVEVLRGPQGTLYGRNATGGTINVISRDPIDEFEIMGNLQAGNYSLFHFDGAINIPMGDKFAARVAYLNETRDGYLSSGGMDVDLYGYRAKLLFKPTDRLSILATYEYFHQNDLGSNTVPIPGSAGNLPCLGPPGAPPPPTCGYFVPDVDGDGVADDFLDANGNANPDGIADIVQTGWITDGDPWSNDPWHPEGLDYITKKAYSLKVDWDLGFGVLTAIPSFADSYNHNVDDHLTGISQSPTGALGEGQVNLREQTSYEVRLSSPADSDWFWIIGYYYMESDNASPGMSQDPTAWFDDRYHFATKSNPTESTAIFAQTTYPLTDIFRLTGGIRSATDDLSMNWRYGLSLSDGVTVADDSGWLHHEQESDSTTYKVGIELDVFDDSMLYAQWATGFKQGGLNMSAPPSLFQPEELDAYELGLKNRFLDGRLQLNLEAFYYKYDNMQAQMPDFLPIADTGAVDMVMSIKNAREGTLKGIDLEMDYLFTRDDMLNISFSYLNSEVGEFFLPPNPFGNPAPFDMTGREMSSSPKWAGTIAYEHVWTLNNGATITGRIDTKISAGYYRTLEQWQPYAWEDGYHRSNFNIKYRSAEGKWSVSVWGKNLEDDAQYTWTVPFYRGMIKPPRTFGASLAFRF